MFREQIPEESVNAFRTAFEKTIIEADLSKLGYIGILGSAVSTKPQYAGEVRQPCDIDVVMFPAADAKIGEGIQAMFDFYRTLDSILAKDHENAFLAPATRMAHQDEVNWIIGQTRGVKGRIPVHTLYFPDYASLIKMSPQGFIDAVTQESSSYYGQLSTAAPIDQQKLEPFLFMLDFQIELLHDRYPLLLMRQKTEHLCEYISKNYGVPYERTPAAFATTAHCARTARKLLQELDAA